ncbi:MAG: RraA family protein [Thiotrichaceae bacterium]|nr:RraA family protein [Thiotrichaceae bacterium]
MNTLNPLFANYSPTAYADALPREQFIDYKIKPLWEGMPRIAGPAYTVQLVAGDNLMLHAAVYNAPTGSILVIDAGDDSHAVAGGNVCAIAQQRGIAGMIIDGVIRDIAEIRESKFPIYALGCVAKPGIKQSITPLNQTIICGSVTVNPNDIVVADEEGIAIIPHVQSEEVFAIAKQRTEVDEMTSLKDWKAAHHKKIMHLLNQQS